MQRKAFTLIELLVVIAIIAILAAILFPVFAQAKLAAKKSVALSNTKQIAIGLDLYVNDYDDMIPSAAYKGVPTVNRTPVSLQWCPAHVLMYPYTKNYQIWNAPGDTHTANRNDEQYLPDGLLTGKFIPLSFEYMGPINTVQANGYDLNTGIGSGLLDVGATPNPLRSTTSFDEPSNTISFAEIWDPAGNSKVGQWGGSYANGCDVVKLAGRTPTTSANPTATGGNVLPPGCTSSGYYAYQPTPGYGGLANYAMIDGSAKALTWGAVRANDFYKFKVQKPTTVYTP